MENILKQLQESLINGDKVKSEDLAKKAISNGMDPIEVLNNGMMPGLAVVGKKFKAEEIFLPELVRAGDAGSLVVAVIEDAVKVLNKDMPSKGTFAVGTVKDDVHSIGKNLVSMMMKVNGFEVVDLGVDVSPKEFLEIAGDVDVIGLSALLTLATKNMENTIKIVREKFPNKVIIIGGAATDPTLAQKFDVLYGSDAAICPDVIENNMN